MIFSQVINLPESKIGHLATEQAVISGCIGFCREVKMGSCRVSILPSYHVIHDRDP